MQLSMPIFIPLGFLSKFIQLVSLLKGVLIFKRQHLQTLTAASW